MKKIKEIKQKVNGAFNSFPIGADVQNVECADGTSLKDFLNNSFVSLVQNENGNYTLKIGQVE